MGLKINATIGTNMGITKEAYIRIVDYNFSKNGNANFRTELFQKQEDATSSPMMGGWQAQNQEIGNSVSISLTKEVTETIKVKRMIPVQKEVTTIIDGVETKSIQPKIEEQEIEETITKTVPDLSQLVGKDIFEMGYTALKKHLSKIYSEESIIDA